MVLIWLRDRADLAQTLFPLSASAFRYCRGQCFYSPQNLSPGSPNWLSQHTLFLPLPCFMSRGGSWSTSAMRNAAESQSPVLGHLPTLLFSQRSWRAGGLLLISQLCKGVGYAEEEKILHSGFRAKHFNLYIWNYLLGFHFDEIRDLLQIFKISSCI